MIAAAGGVVTRTSPGGRREVLLVHRARYDDWSFPKGKLDPGETPSEAALREVREETGLWCAIGPEIGAVEYIDADGEHKVVTYWSMTADGGAFAPNDEVDEIEWLAVGDALERLSYEQDRSLLRRFDPPTG